MTMMRSRALRNIFFAAFFCLLLPQYAKAGETHGSASLTFDDVTGILHGYSTTDPDYSVQGYYNSWVLGGLLDVTHDGPEGYGFTFLDVQLNINQGRAEQATQAEATADTEYRLESLHQVEALYYEYLYLDPPNDPEDRYIDYHNFESVGGGTNYEYSHTFHGPGPAILMDAGSRVIDLGVTYDLKRTGVPHHLKVVSDGFIESACGRKERRIEYQVVGFNNRGTGRTHLQEQQPAGLVDSCSGYQPSGTYCLPKANGIVTDTLKVGIPGAPGTCPQSIDPNCGYVADVNRWQWCPPGGSVVTLGTFTYEVRWNRIVINGRDTPWPSGGYFFP